MIGSTVHVCDCHMMTLTFFVTFYMPELTKTVLFYVSLCVINRYYESHMIIYVKSKARKLE